jgi:hypothetical protein
MFRIGTLYTTRYTIVISPPPMDLLQNKFYLNEETKRLIASSCRSFYDYEREYFLCSVHTKYGAYVDLAKDDNFPFISFRFPPWKTGKDRTPEETIYENQYRYWAHIKDQQQPMLYLHHSTISRVIDKCKELSE